VRLEPDSVFDVCAACPKLETERTYTLRSEGYEPHDYRIVPSQFATFTLFIRLLQEGNQEAARRLLGKPAKLREAIADGWGGPLKRGAWKIVGSEPDQPWPLWIEAHLDGPKGTKRYLIRFALQDGRWIISDWGPAAEPGARGTTGGAR